MLGNTNLFVYICLRNDSYTGSKTVYMENNKLPQPTESELEILQTLWQHGPCTVRFVNEELNKQREIGYTTTLKLMQIMLEKGLVSRNTESRTHIYQAVVSESHTQKQLLTKFMDKAFRGSAASLVMQALGNHKASKRELEEIKALIEQIESGQSGSKEK